MPYKKKVYKKKVYKKKGVKKRYPKAILYKPLHNQPVPDMMTDTFELCWQSTLAAGWAQAQFGIYANVMIPATTTSVMQIPYTNARWGGTGTTGSAGSFVDGLTSARSPAGYQLFQSVTAGGACLYQRYTVTGVKIAVTCQPQSLSDNVAQVVYPEQFSNLSAAATSKFTSFAEASMTPFAKDKVANAYNDSDKNTISTYIDIAKFLGITKRVLYDDVAYSGFNVTNSGAAGIAAILVPATSSQVFLNYWVVTCDGAVTAQPMTWSVRMKYYVTFRQPAGQQLTN